MKVTSPTVYIKFDENEMQAKIQRIALLNSQIVDILDTAPKNDLKVNVIEGLQTQNEQTNHMIFFFLWKTENQEGPNSI